jgi:sugar O-acyltransferase (sialic acid O-acetyltransferase NeuD family)
VTERDAARGGVVVWGATGQAKVLKPIIEALGFEISLFFDRADEVISPIAQVPLVHNESELEDWVERNRDATSRFAIAIGGRRGRDRLQIAGRMTDWGLSPLTLVHESAWVAPTAALEDGSQALAMAAVSEEAVLGAYTIVNTKASVDHECSIGRGVHIMPGATVAGSVEVGDYAAIGSGATVLPRLRIGAGAFIGAGAVVTSDVAPGQMVVGIPARSIGSPAS